MPYTGSFRMAALPSATNACFEGLGWAGRVKRIAVQAEPKLKLCSCSHEIMDARLSASRSLLQWTFVFYKLQGYPLFYSFHMGQEMQSIKQISFKRFLRFPCKDGKISVAYVSSYCTALLWVGNGGLRKSYCCVCASKDLTSPPMILDKKKRRMSQEATPYYFCIMACYLCWGL